jgi:2-polyprenyl-3-methyl-5-hydroxy-6-metoxy-1,4-benzoquinol methylase/glycosyltransferase involved in cell wall biosynthesis
MAEVVMVLGGMMVGPKTLDTKSLGGSETAAICAAKAIRKLGHMVTVFGNVEEEGIDEDGIRWCSIAQYRGFVETTETDIIIAQRDPSLLSFQTNSKKNVLWVHDLATYAHAGVFQGFAWNIDEVWTVSQWHKEQFHKITGYPLTHIYATRNGINAVGNLMDLPRLDTELLYAARPERGLINLVRPGGIMSRLPEFTLKVAMYDNWPPQMREYYQQLFDMAKALPNVEIIGSKTQKQLRQLMKSAAAYVYPTTFEEVSCIIAREAIEQKLPFIYTPIGALPETMQDCGHKVVWPKDDIGSDQFCQLFADQVRSTLGNREYIEELQRRCARRTDLYWDSVAFDWEGRFAAKKPTPYSMCLSLIKDGDVYAAAAVAEKYQVKYWQDHIKNYYGFAFGEVSMQDHYKAVYQLEESKKVPERQTMRTLKGTGRYDSIRQCVDDIHIKKVLEYGCAEGPIILQLAQDFPDKTFIGIDIVEANVALCKKFAADNKIDNVMFFHGDTEHWPELLNSETFDCAIIAEVLEHTIEPWIICDVVESKVIKGGRVIVTVPYGSWEWDGLVNNPKQWPWRAHIWHLNKDALRHMFQDKDSIGMTFLPYAAGNDGKIVGNTVYAYFADHTPVFPLDALDKAKTSRYRQSIAFCVIAMDAEEYIVRMLKSIVQVADVIQIAMGPSTDDTLMLATIFMEKYPWIDFRIVPVPKIEVGKFGFDDARNASVQGIETDWIFWIDTDEYLSGGNLQMHMRNNAFDSYAINQHHFTCEPRGTPTQLDKPARMYRNNGSFQFFGKVHEHAEMGFNGGPGFVMLLNSADLGHTGYVNEAVRRNRFSRNFPLLKWDREVYPERKIGKFLWFRDMFHQMQWLMQNKRVNEARAIAQDALAFFDKYKDEFMFIGSGPQASLHYYAQALQILGQGQAVKIKVELEGMVAEYDGMFRNAREAVDVAEKAIQEQFDKRNSGYWQ